MEAVQWEPQTHALLCHFAETAFPVLTAIISALHGEHFLQLFQLLPPLAQSILDGVRVLWQFDGRELPPDLLSQLTCGEALYFQHVSFYARKISSSYSARPWLRN